MRIGRIHLERWFRSGSRWIHLLIVGRGVLSCDKYSSSTHVVECESWLLGGLRTNASFVGDLGRRRRAEQTSRVFWPSPSVSSSSRISFSVDYFCAPRSRADRTTRTYSLASIAFRAREMPGPTNTLSCAYHVRIICVEVNASAPCGRDLSGSDPAPSDVHSRCTPMRI